MRLFIYLFMLLLFLMLLHDRKFNNYLEEKGGYISFRIGVIITVMYSISLDIINIILS